MNTIEIKEKITIPLIIETDGFKIELFTEIYVYDYLYLDILEEIDE